MKKNKSKTSELRAFNKYVNGLKAHIEREFVLQLNKKIDIPREQLLHATIFYKDFENLAKLLENKFYIDLLNTPNNFGDLHTTPLEYAILYTSEVQMECIKILIAKGAQSNHALHFAIENDKPAVAQYLIKNMHNIDINSQDDHGLSPLMFACIKSDLSTFNLLLQHKELDINIQDHQQLTALNYAAFASTKPIMLNLLVTNGADIKLVDKSGCTFLHHWATSIKDNEPELNKIKFLFIKKLLAERSDININAQDTLGHTPLTFAIDNVEAVKFFVNELKIDVNMQLGDLQSTALHLAVENGNLEVISTLIQAGADLNARNKDGATPLYLSLYEKVIQPNIAVQKLLLDQGADPNIATDKNQITPLLAAIYQNNEQAVMLLAKHQSTNINAVNILGASALTYSILDGNQNIVKTLLNHQDIDLSLKTYHDLRNPLHHAIVVNNIEFVNSILRHPRCSEELINQLDIHGHSPLHMAIIEGNNKIIQLLVHAGAKIELISDEINIPSPHIEIQTQSLVEICQHKEIKDDTKTIIDKNIPVEVSSATDINLIYQKDIEEKQENINWDDYFKKLHQYYQNKKTKLAPSIINPDFISTKNWNINGKAITSLDQNILETTDINGKKIFVLTCDDIDPSKGEVFARAIKKGFIRDEYNKKTTGMKLLYHNTELKGFEVKIHQYGDSRLFGNKIYRNPDGELLFVLKETVKHRDLDVTQLAKMPSIKLIGEEVESVYDYTDNSVDHHIFSLEEKLIQDTTEYKVMGLNSEAFDE